MLNKAPLKETVYSLRHGQVAAQVCLTDSARPLFVMLHGWQDNSGSFNVLAETLSQHADLVMPDWPGHGLSDHKGEGYFYPFFDYVDDLNQLIEQLPLEGRPLYIIGHSLGALVGSCWCATWPEKVQGLVMIEALGPMSERDSNVVERLRRASEGRDRLKPMRKLNSLDEAVKLRMGINKVSDEAIRPLVERGTVCDGEQWFWRHDARLRSESNFRMSPRHAEQIVRSIQCPVLALLGDDGYPELRSHQANDRKAWFAQLEVALIQGKHHCHMQSPDQTLEAILHFAQRTGR
ncbi:alpha/beta hydrolase [Veronia nyctiphanis]|uniref:Alpha/beta hydrolase n=1 Tax=Veronia nyctiphanis TaxID=1278244 RepID=A0A4Q0YTZ2_9GAMM|nr:alpha/beta hydrolase [Veronia nyctiphanis]RXJ74762.1 alpha/beta hydrolase [Veronia nyctiphanis]